MSVNLRLMKPLTPKWEDSLVRSTRYLLLLCLVCYIVYTDYERAGYIAAVMFGRFPLWTIAAGLFFFFFFSDCRTRTVPSHPSHQEFLFCETRGDGFLLVLVGAWLPSFIFTLSLVGMLSSALLRSSVSSAVCSTFETTSPWFA